MDEVILRVGGIYRSRAGAVHEIETESDNPTDEYPFEGGGISWTRSGRYYADGSDDRCDLIAEVSGTEARPRPSADNVNHPKHYNSHPSGVECVTIREHMPSNIGDVFKYLWRAGLKDSAPTHEDYNKAVWYLLREFKRLGVKLTVSQEVIEGLR